VVLPLADKGAIWFKFMAKTRKKKCYRKLFVCITSCFLAYADWLSGSEDVGIQSEGYCSISTISLKVSVYCNFKRTSGKSSEQSLRESSSHA